MADESKVIDIGQYIQHRRPSLKKYGDPAGCPECGSSDFWRPRCKNTENGRVVINSLECTSDECTGNVFFVLKDGIIT